MTAGRIPEPAAAPAADPVQAAPAAPSGPWGTVSEVVIGEITTRLLLSSEALGADAGWAVLAALVPGSRPLRAGHPVERITSADLSINVDSHLATLSGAKVPAIGVAAAHAVLTGGHVIQGSAYARVVRGEGDGRRRWAHYNSRPSYVEIYRAAKPHDLAASYLATRTHPAYLDLGGAGRRVIEAVHTSPALDKRVRLRTRPLSLRWAVQLDPGLDRASMEFTRFPDGGVQITARTAPSQLPDLIRFCEDVALHTWLLSTMSWTFERAANEDDELAELGRALECLGHLWSPNEGNGEELDYLWDSVEARYHLTRGWQSQVTRIRDHVSLRTLRLLEERAMAAGRTTW